MEVTHHTTRGAGGADGDKVIGEVEARREKENSEAAAADADAERAEDPT